MRPLHAALLVGTLTIAAVGCGEEDTRTSSDIGGSDDEFVPIIGGVGWQAQAPLIYRRPTGSMRAAEYGVEGQPGAVLAVSYFPPEQGGGGEVRRNVSRWVGQLRQPPGAEPIIREREINDLTVTTVDVRGTFVGQIGDGNNPPIPDFRLLGAIVQAETGLVFFKLTGPGEAVASAEDAFSELVSSIHPE